MRFNRARRKSEQSRTTIAKLKLPSSSRFNRIRKKELPDTIVAAINLEVQELNTIVGG
jgi:hypothetical protein